MSPYLASDDMLRGLPPVVFVVSGVGFCVHACVFLLRQEND